MKLFAFFADDYEEEQKTGFVVAENRDRAIELLMDKAYSGKHEVKSYNHKYKNYIEVETCRGKLFKEYWYVSQAIEVDRELVVFPYKWEREDA